MSKHQILLQYLTLKVSESDWMAVASTAMDLHAMRLGVVSPGSPVGVAVSYASEVKPDSPETETIPPVPLEIQHKLDEVKDVLSLSDEELIDRMFPVEQQEI